MTALHISDQLALPVDFVTKTCAILAQRRKGKTYTASVLAEELHAAGQPFVALDPTGAWWGLRARVCAVDVVAHGAEDARHTTCRGQGPGPHGRPD